MRLAGGTTTSLLIYQSRFRKAEDIHIYDMSIYLREERVHAVADTSLTNKTAHHLINAEFQT
jgi:hypothetical protein